MSIGVEKLNTYEGITVKALLDSGATGMFMDKRIVARHGFKLQKLERPIIVKNMDGTNNNSRKNEDVCDLEKIEVILGMPWLAVHNPEIN